MTTVLDRPAPAPALEVAPEPADTLEIVVTLEDIRLGERLEGSSCAFSLALGRAGYPNPFVGYLSVRPGGTCGGGEFAHTPESEAWVRAFDHGDPVAPERFVLHRAR